MASTACAPSWPIAPQRNSAVLRPGGVVPGSRARPAGRACRRPGRGPVNEATSGPSTRRGHAGEGAAARRGRCGSGVGEREVREGALQQVQRLDRRAGAVGQPGQREGDQPRAEAVAEQVDAQLGVGLVHAAEQRARAPAGRPPRRGSSSASRCAWRSASFAPVPAAARRRRRGRPRRRLAGPARTASAKRVEDARASGVVLSRRRSPWSSPARRRRRPRAEARPSASGTAPAPPSVRGRASSSRAISSSGLPLLGALEARP